MPSCDTIIVGGGSNGLACATRLAQSGAKVLVLEAAPTPGGGAATREFAPFYHASPLAHLLHMLDPRVVEGMDLARHGLSYAATGLATTSLSATGNHLVLEGAVGARLVGDLPDSERVAWATLRQKLLTFAGVLAPFRAMAAPRIAAGVGNELFKLARLGLQLRAIGRDDFRELLRMILINVADVLEDDLTDDRLRGALAFDTVLGAWLGPRSPNSLILLLNRLAGEAAGQTAALALPKGGMGAVAAAMARAATGAGVTLRCNARVARIVIADDQVTGVVLQGGAAIMARRVVSGIHPQTTFLNLVGARELDTGFVRRVRAIRSRGGAAKLHLALTGTPDFHGANLRSRLVIAPSVRAVEAAFNAVKYGEVPARPVLEIVIASAFEAGHAPEGHHVLSAIVQFAPHAPKAGLDAARAEMLANTLAVLEDHAPGINSLIKHAEFLMPQDIEATYGMVGGNWHHGELAVEQMLFLRPVIGAAQYSTPIPGLWLCSAGTHPGGGISGASGWNAAGRILGVAGAA